MNSVIVLIVILLASCRLDNHLMVKRNQFVGWEHQMSFWTKEDCLKYMNVVATEYTVWEWKCVP